MARIEIETKSEISILQVRSAPTCYSLQIVDVVALLTLLLLGFWILFDFAAKDIRALITYLSSSVADSSLSLFELRSDLIKVRIVDVDSLAEIDELLTVHRLLHEVACLEERLFNFLDIRMNLM